MNPLYQLYEHCTLCPRECGVDRTTGLRGFCGADNTAELCRIGLHFMEEPPISGQKGSGTVFFAHCSLRCLFCQNQKISRKDSIGRRYTPSALADAYLDLQAKGAHNINLVSPTHYLPSVIESVKLAKEKGLTLPVVYNTGGYETAQSIDLLEETVDIYLTDYKYHSPYLAERYSTAADYPDLVLTALEHMVQKVGPPVFKADGLLQKGVIVRHLLLPGQISDTLSVLRTVANRFGDVVLVSLMRQYTPIQNHLPDQLSRPVTDKEYATARECFLSLGLNGFFQEKDSVGTDKIPNWNE